MVGALVGAPTIRVGPPGVGVLTEAGIDQRSEVVAVLEVFDLSGTRTRIEPGPDAAVVTETPGTRTEVGLGFVDTTFDPPDVVAGDLVAHGVGQGLHRMGRVDLVAVEVEQGVELGER